MSSQVKVTIFYFSLGVKAPPLKSFVITSTTPPSSSSESSAPPDAPDAPLLS
jgi:hypothetical protein